MFTKSYAGAGLREAVTILNASNRLGNQKVRRLIILIAGSDADDTQSADTLVKPLNIYIITLIEYSSILRVGNCTIHPPFPTDNTLNVIHVILSYTDCQYILTHILNGLIR